VAGKVSGPGSGPPVGGPSDDQKSESPSAVGGPRFADKLAETDATKRAEGPSAAAAQAARGAKGIELTADIATELSAGRIDPKAALDRVIERVLDKQLGPGAPAAVREQVRAALETAVADDPALSDKIRSLAR
jgi:hypothetical protein